MVNSPSRPNVRPVAPPHLGGHVRHPIPLPYPAAHPAQGGYSPVPTVNQGKNPSNQGSSSLIKANVNFSMAPGIPSRNSPSVYIRVHLRSPSPAFPKPENWGAMPDFPGNQGKSNQIKPSRPLSRVPRISRFPPPAFPNTEIREPFPMPPAIKRQSRQKPQQSRLIKPHQGKRQIFHGHPHPASSHRHPSPEFPLCAFAPLRLRAFALSPTSGRTGANVTPCECDSF